MTHAELLRKHATDATNEGGMWFSGEYMTMLASMAESNEAENAKLRKQSERLFDTTLELGTENKKLWELVIMYNDYISQDRCDGCILKSQCNDGKVSECWQLTEIRERARELGVEVDQ